MTKFFQGNWLGSQPPSPSLFLPYLDGHPWAIPWQVMYRTQGLQKWERGVVVACGACREEPWQEHSSSRWTGGFLQRIQPISDSHIKIFGFKMNKFQDKVFMWSETLKGPNRRSYNSCRIRSRNFQAMVKVGQYKQIGWSQWIWQHATQGLSWKGHFNFNEFLFPLDFYLWASSTTPFSKSI